MMRLGQSLDSHEKHGLPVKYLAFLTWLLMGVVLTACGFSGLLASVPFDVQGFGVLNEVLFSSAPPTVFDDQNMDRMFAGFAQAFALCVFSAVLPLSAHVWSRLRDKARGNSYVIFWGTTVALPFLYFFLKDFLGPLLVDVFDVIS